MGLRKNLLCSILALALLLFRLPDGWCAQCSFPAAEKLRTPALKPLLPRNPRQTPHWRWRT